MFQFNRDFCDDFCALRDVALSRSPNPALQTFEAWLSRTPRGSRGVEAAGLLFPSPRPFGRECAGTENRCPFLLAVLPSGASSPGSASRRGSRPGLRPAPPRRPLRGRRRPRTGPAARSPSRDVPFEAHAFFGAAADGDLPLLHLFLDAGMPAATRDQWGNSALLEAARATGPTSSRGSSHGARRRETRPGASLPSPRRPNRGAWAPSRPSSPEGPIPTSPRTPRRVPGEPLSSAPARPRPWRRPASSRQGGASPRLAAPPLAAPLFLAAESGHAPTVALLLAKGANPNARGSGARPRSGCRSGTATSRRSGSSSSPGPT